MELKELYEIYEAKSKSLGIEIESYDLFAKEIKISVWDCLETSKKILDFYDGYAKPHDFPLWCCANDFKNDWSTLIFKIRPSMDEKEFDRYMNLVEEKFIKDLRQSILKELINLFSLFHE